MTDPLIPLVYSLDLNFKNQLKKVAPLKKHKRKCMKILKITAMKQEGNASFWHEANAL